MSKTVWQTHHLTYPDGRCHPPEEWTVSVTKGEHLILTWLQRHKKVSPGFLSALMYEVSKSH